MADKILGRVDPSGNYGLTQEQADKLREWAKKRTARIEADPTIPRRYRERPPGYRLPPNKPPGRACVVCEARFIRIVPPGVPPLCNDHLAIWEGGGLPEVRQWIADGEIVPHPWLGMIWKGQKVWEPRELAKAIVRGDDVDGAVTTTGEYVRVTDIEPGSVTKTPRHENSVTKKAGRPKKDDALSPAARSKAYRAKVKAARKAKRK